MMKRFEGVFRRYVDNPSSLIPDVILDLAERDAGVRQQLDQIPMHEYFKTNGDAYAVMRSIVDEAPFFSSREEGAEIKVGLKVEQDTIRLTVEIRSEKLAELTETAKTIEDMVKNHHGTFSDVSSAMTK